MAESPLQKLQRLAREKKAAEASAAAAASPSFAEQVTPNTEANLELRMKLAAEEVKLEEKKDGLVHDSASSAVVIDARNEQDNQLGSTESSIQPNISAGVQAVSNSTDSGGSNSANFPAAPPARSASNHPLAMQFAELEQGILARDPQFKTILRDIHRQLGTEPELVTQMSEAEIALVVQGLVQRAQEEIVTPAATKAAKKKVITVDDL